MVLPKYLDEFAAVVKIILYQSGAFRELFFVRTKKEVANLEKRPHLKIYVQFLTTVGINEQYEIHRAPASKPQVLKVQYTKKLF